MSKRTQTGQNYCNYIEFKYLKANITLSAIIVFMHVINRLSVFAMHDTCQTLHNIAPFLSVENCISDHRL